MIELLGKRIENTWEKCEIFGWIPLVVYRNTEMFCQQIDFDYYKSYAANFIKKSLLFQQFTAITITLDTKITNEDKFSHYPCLLMSTTLWTDCSYKLHFNEQNECSKDEDNHLKVMYS